MDISFVPLIEDHKIEVIDIFNYYVEHSTAAYRSERVAYSFFENLVDENVLASYAITNKCKEVIGFCMLEKHKNLSTFNKLGDCMYFLKENTTGKGIGKETLKILQNDAKESGINKIIIDICDENTYSLNFHKANGFKEYGRLEKCWTKFGRELGIVYMQKSI